MQGARATVAPHDALASEDLLAEGNAIGVALGGQKGARESH
jgi:hypothetical protein